MSEREFVIWRLFVLWVIGFIVGAAISATLENRMWKCDAVKRGYAEYNSKTGAWQWKGDGK